MPMLINYLLVGALVGAALGYFGKCSSGTCPLTATWWRGAIYGVVVATLLYFVSGNAMPAGMNESTPNVERIGQNQFDATVTQSRQPVVADFYATWCGPCKILSPQLDQIAGEFTNRVKFVKINVDEAPALCQRWGIDGIPALLFFQNGKMVDRVTGLPPAADLQARVAGLTRDSTPSGGG